MQTLTPIDIYLESVQPPVYKSLLEDLRQNIKQLIPGAEEVISYQIATFKYNGKAVVGFAAYKNHCSLFPFSGGLLAQFKEDLAAFKQTKGSLHFSPSQPLPMHLLKKLVDAKLLANAKKK